MVPYAGASPAMQRAQITVATKDALLLVAGMQAYCKSKQVGCPVRCCSLSGDNPVSSDFIVLLEPVLEPHGLSCTFYSITQCSKFAFQAFCNLVVEGS